MNSKQLLAAQLDKYYNSNVLKKILPALLNPFYKQYQSLLKKHQVRFPEDHTKAELLRFWTEIWFHEEIRFHFINSLPTHTKTVLEKLTWTPEGLFEDDIEAMFGIKIQKSTENYSGNWYTKILPEMLLFSCEELWGWRYSNRGIKFQLSLCPPLRALAKKTFPPPKGFDLEVVELPSEGITVYENQGMIFQTLSICKVFMEQGDAQIIESGKAFKSKCDSISKDDQCSRVLSQDI